MPEDRTTPMRTPGRGGRQEPEFDQQETVFSDQESVTPPTIPLGDSGARPEQARGPAFVRATPAGGTTPAPFAPPGGGFGPPQPAVAPDQTMLIRERPSPVFAWLVLVDGPDRGGIGTVHSLRPDTTTIGRAAANHIALRDDTCSAQHARIRIEVQEGQAPAYVLYDMGSSNGTFVGSRETYKEVESRQYRHELQDGDYLLVGETTLVFKKL